MSTVLMGVQAAYFLATVLFIAGLRRTGSQAAARHGNVQGSISGERAAIVDLARMVALHGSIGGLAAAAIGVVGLLQAAAVAAAASALAEMSAAASEFGLARAMLAVIGASVGAASFPGALIAYSRLQGWIGQNRRFPGQRALYVLLLLAAIVLGVMISVQLDARLIIVLVAVCLILGVGLALAIGAADLPLAVLKCNAATGLAVALEGYVIHSPALMIAGMAVAAGCARLAWSPARATSLPPGNE